VVNTNARANVLSSDVLNTLSLMCPPSTLVNRKIEQLEDAPGMTFQATHTQAPIDRVIGEIESVVNAAAGGTRR
jgi:hypothetical protein